MVKFAFDRIENNVGKGENAGYKHFFSFPTMFSERYFPRAVDSVVMGKNNTKNKLLLVFILNFINPLPNENIYALSKMKPFANYKSVAQIGAIFL